MYMFKYILKRLALMLFTFSVIMLICFVLIKSLPIPLNAGLGKDKELLEANLRARGYYDPIMVQLGHYLERIFTKGDFGIGTTMSAYVNKPVWESFVKCMPPTILINVYSSIIGVPIGLALGIFAALKKNKWQDQVISTGVMVLISVPSIVYAFLIQYFLCFKLKLFPLIMANGTNYLTWEMFHSMMPAVLALCLGSIAGYGSLYSRGTYRSSDKRVHVACKDKRSYERAGDCAPCVKKCNGADFPDDFGRICFRSQRIAYHRKVFCDTGRWRIVFELHPSLRLRLLYVAFGLLHSGWSSCRYHCRYQLWFD